jgi:16S rRNA (uracil1498-N3)-methyltransferase
MRRFFIDPSMAARPRSVIQGSDARHIKNVLRLKRGDAVELFDGLGRTYAARIVGYGPEGVDVAISDATCPETESPLDVTVAQAFLKEKKMDRLVRQLTELGVNRLIPFFAARSIPRPTSRRLAGRLSRWNKISRESLKQCNRGRAPEICEPVFLEDALNLAAAARFKLLFWERASASLQDGFQRDLVSSSEAPGIFLMLGPEGGFTGDEVKKAEKAGFFTATLGPRILRAETATVAACAIVQYLLGDMGSEASICGVIKGLQ